MNTDNPKSLIKAAFRNPKETPHRRSILIPAAPLDLEEIMKSAAENEYDENQFAEFGLETLFEDIGWEYTPFFAFYWQSLGPMVWECYLNLLHIGKDQALVCRRQDAFPCWQAVAQVRHPSDPAVMSAFFKALINEKGAAFGIELFGSLPSNTDNKSEDTVPESVVWTAYWNWMNWAENTVGVDWQGLGEEILEREKSPIMYPLELPKRLPRGAGADPTKYLEERADANGSLTVRAKRAIFDAYFKQSYGPY